MEVHNSTEQPILLNGCALQTNRSKSASHVLPEVSLGAGGYEVVYINQTGLTLTKTTTGTVYLLSPDLNQEIDSQYYQNLATGTSWSRFDESDWRQTFEVTPGEDNIYTQYLPCEPGYFRSEEANRCRKSVDEAELEQCDIGKERNPETNRCRNIESASSSLVPCRAGQERSPETNRCRNIESVASGLVPCGPNQERDPETNRCRQVGSSDSQLVPCREGQERDPETNRCRNIKSNTVPTAGFAAIPVADSPTATAGWWLFGGVTILAAGYAGWEWRREVGGAIRRVASVFVSRGK